MNIAEFNKSKFISELVTLKCKFCEQPFSVRNTVKERARKCCSAECLKGLQAKNVRNKHSNIPRSEETIRKIRASVTQYRLEHGCLKIIVGKHEKHLLDIQEQMDHCRILRQYPIKELGYIVDGYCPETNTVYEVYERFHLRTRERDEKRQREIQECLKCNFQISWITRTKDSYAHN